MPCGCGPTHVHDKHNQILHHQCMQEHIQRQCEYEIVVTNIV
jgi:hypothetical protein